MTEMRRCVISTLKAKVEAQAAELKSQKAEIAKMKVGENKKVIKGTAGGRRRLQRMMQDVEDPLVPASTSKGKSTYAPSGSPIKAPTTDTPTPNHSYVYPSHRTFEIH